METRIYIMDSNPLRSHRLRSELSEETGFAVMSFADLESMSRASRELAPSAMLISCGSGDPESLTFVSSLDEDAPAVLAMVDAQDEDARQKAMAALGPLRTASMP